MQISKITKTFKVLSMKRTYITEKGIRKIDITKFMGKTSDYMDECKRAADALAETGCFTFQDPRIAYSHNDNLLDMLERYFENRANRYYNGETNLEDIRPEIHYQSGLTPEKAGKARDINIPFMEKLTGENRPQTPIPIPNNMNWRYLWRIDEPKNAKSNIVEPPQHIPKDFPEFASVMGTWGKLLRGAGVTACEMVALGLGLEQNTFSERLQGGSHILSPTGSDLKKNKVGDVLAAFHYDLNLCTLHGQSRFPGLDIWLRDGTKVPVQIPKGWILIQSGKQMEMLTGGHILAGFHEVIYSERTKLAKEKAEKEGRPLWRVSSTVFLQAHEDVILEPMGKFSTEETRKLYPPVSVLKQVEDEIKEIYVVN